MGWGLAILSLAIALGLGLGAVRVFGARLGISAVLFSSLLLGQLGFAADPAMLATLRDFSLTLFVYAIGLQVGPGFLTSLRSDGLRMNMLALAVLLLGAAMAALTPWVAGLPQATSPGLFTGSFTTTAGLGAAQEAVRVARAKTPDKGDADVKTIGLAYTVTYPFALVGPILSIVLLKKLFRVDVHEEARRLLAEGQALHPPIEWTDLEVTEPQFIDIPLRSHPLLMGKHIVITRLLRAGVQTVPNGDSSFALGDVCRAVGPRAELDALLAALGKPTQLNLETLSDNLQKLDLVVTRPQMLRRSLAELHLIRRTGVTVAWVVRAGVFLSPSPSLRLQFGDRVRVVGPTSGLQTVEAELGNSQDALTRVQLLPVFIGIVLGVLVGAVPIYIPGLHADVRIGLAGGALIAAIGLSQLGNIGSVVWYMPVAANQLVQDFGLAVFLACTGLKLGNHLAQSIVHNNGLALLAWGAALTMVPPLVIGAIARIFLKMNFTSISGLISGAMTSSPALNFSRELTGSDAPAVAFATVAPLAELVPILCAQVLAGMLTS
jgi:putative transport protein